ncbi:MAG TPA: hypothetical protein VGO11_13890 [Chthoniobacteraceae bacterium]|jgi:hypothetical protein|nr:hypothetical protein [Chthoniobacteraceae bacterium]
MNIRHLLHATVTALLAALVFVPPLAAAADADAPLKTGSAADIVTAIQAAQKRLVRESYGQLAHECFTEVDLEQFRRDKVAWHAAEALQNHRKFMEGVLALRAQPERAQTAFVSGCRKPLRLTWAELGHIGRDGQTDAGNAAERDIANAAADLLERLVKLSAEEVQAAFLRKR